MGKLEKKYRNELVIIGVQSPKYPAEADPVNVQHAVERYQIEHPVVDDRDHQVWDAYAVNAWPTLVFISPRGEVVGQHAGEAPFAALDRVVGQMVQEYEAEGSLSRRPVDLHVQQFSRPLDELSFPGKVLATDPGIFIADSDHNRIVITDRKGQVKDVAGSSVAGLADGSFQTAQFYRPQGMALDASQGILYVADMENHAIRAVDLARREVNTVAGTGEQAMRRIRSGPARQIGLSSPWDVALHGSDLYIAMAGSHQIWRLNLVAETVGVWAGTGHEGIRDASLRDAWLAQPMGLVFHGDDLFVACAEAQAVRQIAMMRDTVVTLVGEGLFAFGDRDGPARVALLQHNQDVAYAEGIVWIADTYNNKVKELNLTSYDVTTFLGSGDRGLRDGPGQDARFDEPGGISVHDGTMYIADTNNHVIRTANLQDRHVGTFRIKGLDATRG